MEPKGSLPFMTACNKFLSWARLIQSCLITIHFDGDGNYIFLKFPFRLLVYTALYSFIIQTTELFIITAVRTQITIYEVRLAYPEIILKNYWSYISNDWFNKTGDTTLPTIRAEMTYCLAAIEFAILISNVQENRQHNYISILVLILVKKT
jgi:hypothetical protein